MQEPQLQNYNNFKRLLVSIYSRLLLSFTHLHAKGCYRMIEQLEQKEIEQQLQVS